MAKCLYGYEFGVNLPNHILNLYQSNNQTIGQSNNRAIKQSNNPPKFGIILKSNLLRLILLPMSYYINHICQ